MRPQTALLQPRPAAPLATSSQNLHIQSLSSLMAHHQRQFRRLASLVNGAATGDTATLVACSVVAHQHALRTAEAKAAVPVFCATGVNHALHRRFNAGKTLKGILRGCAEQNALGVAAAGGHRYSAVTDVYLYASLSPMCLHKGNANTCGHANNADAVASSPASSAGRTSVRGAVFPCPECWCNLTAVAAMRCEDGETEPMKLFVHAHGEAEAVRSVAVARERLARPVQPAIDVTIVLSG
ncbi:hypothetical protein DQ04_02311060 [Trypanosoma grayi]|uniref:hypothetical protein n=1 Tax=Trypanosoma grayi TaxID=71804 RepID=UPI0004F492C5|nr:hypothetical protein DQ04_02311060 [Trypanosoma grayi]KEG11754.1 hypothetical protein DQ04_02311060 [Trypanosoma grayi]